MTILSDEQSKPLALLLVHVLDYLAFELNAAEFNPPETDFQLGYQNALHDLLEVFQSWQHANPKTPYPSGCDFPDCWPDDTEGFSGRFTIH
jgi:hypothetical protein